MGKPTYELLNRSKEHWAFIRRSDKPNRRIAIFVHGFMGNYLDAWGHLPDLLKRNAGADRDFLSWDFLFIGYSTRQISTYLDIAVLILTEWRKAAKGDSPFDHRYEKVALFGHSLGTLGIRQALCARFKASSRFYDALHSITFFGTPLNGSPLALFCPFYKIADALQPANPQIRMLRVWAESIFDRDPWPTAKVVLGQGDWVVGQSFNELVRWPGDEQPVDQKAFLDHRDLSKPNAWTNCAVTSYIRSALR